MLTDIFILTAIFILTDIDIFILTVIFQPVTRSNYLIFS